VQFFSWETHLNATERHLPHMRLFCFTFLRATMSSAGWASNCS